MKSIHLILIIALALSMLLSCHFQDKRKTEPFKVTYHVEVLSVKCRKLSITYIDSIGLVQDYCFGQSWSKTVCLPSDGIASLYVSDIFDPKDTSHDNYMEESVPNGPAGVFEPFSLWIEHGKRIELTTGRVYESLVNVSLSAP